MAMRGFPHLRKVHGDVLKSHDVRVRIKKIRLMPGISKLYSPTMAGIFCIFNLF
jgi:hypothetical protein